jgi:tetratricopeptide (TPR) repeat protein
MIASSLRISALLVCALALFFATPNRAMAVPGDTPVADPPKAQSAPAAKSKKSDKKKKAHKPEQRKSEQQFLKGYRAAYAMIYRRHQFAAGIDKLKSLGHDDNPDVANLIGFSSRKLGRYDDAKVWYERALAADPKHARTWSYYGMWHAEQGNLLRARDYLATIAQICGTKCREYTELKGVIEGTRVY